MPLRLFNTLTKTKEDFAPIDPKKVRMYVCGPTVYDFAHIGNARPAIVFDLLYRLLRHEYGAEHVTYVRNITDVDDKINARAAERGISIRELTENTARIYLEDVTALGCLPPNVMPRATEHISEMLEIINRLQSAQLAYASTTAEDTERQHLHVLFDVGKKADYGKLSRRSLDEMIAGARVEVAPYKNNPMDFVLWKPSNPDEPGWDSRFGRGRPGWHIECSAMAKKYLGETFDIHGGGVDLMFPHHENEIAQSEGAHGVPLANVWMHNGFLQVEGEKMSKSLGNFFTIRELLADWPGEVLRYQMLKTHYRQPINWTRKSSEEAAVELDHFRVKTLGSDLGHGEVLPAVIDALSDDLNVPKAIAELHAFMAYHTDYKTAANIRKSFEFLGINLDAVDVKAIAERQFGPIDEAEINRAIEARKAARAAKNFAESDRIRDELLAKGIVLKDGPQGTTWEVKR